MTLARRVVLFVIDGLRPDALPQSHTPQIDRLVVSIMDTAPTLAHLLGLSLPPEWHGRVVAEALV
jgi:predicted AlkP superfamily pyrophosphatase or phosphodiesterase